MQGTSIMQVHALDGDRGVPNRLNYTILHGKTYFLWFPHILFYLHIFNYDLTIKSDCYDLITVTYERQSKQPGI